ncbi:hypothetical protein C8J57DRAFT_1520050 [Mycena rebaudengoi]|nr:hypothetical protein C8J57DRAFT_1520050 [Mycena rebaudengoi]
MSTPWPILSYFFTLLCPPGDCTLCTITSLRSTNPRTPCTFFAHPRASAEGHVAHPLRINGFGGACLGYTSHTIPLLRPSARINGFWRCCPWLRARVQPRPSCTNRVSCVRGAGPLSRPFAHQPPFRRPAPAYTCTSTGTTPTPHAPRDGRAA